MYSVDMSSADRYHVKETIALQDSKTVVLFDVDRPRDPSQYRILSVYGKIYNFQYIFRERKH